MKKEVVLVLYFVLLMIVAVSVSSYTLTFSYYGRELTLTETEKLKFSIVDDNFVVDIGNEQTLNDIISGLIVLNYTCIDKDCDDEIYCNGIEICVDNACQAGTPIDCNDGVSCTDNSCDEGNDQCVNAVNDANCDDGIGCTDDICSAVDDCQYIPNNLNCDDGFWCNGFEVCDTLNDCQAGVPIDCNDNVDCTDDSCDEDNDQCVNIANNANCEEGEICYLNTGCGVLEWSYKQITIDHTKVEEDLTNFPMLIDINDIDLATKAQSDGDDILFRDSSGTKLAHEIEYYDNGHLIAWVNIPILSSTEDTILYIYYGNPESDNQENPEAVWDSNYLAVHHLEETSGTVYDSTSNNNDGTPQNGVTQDINGQINGADQFDGNNDRIQLPQIFTTENQFTMEGWIYTGNKQGYAIAQWSNYNGAFIQYYSPRNQFEMYVNRERVEKTSSINQWHHVVGTFDGTTAKLYIDGDTPVTTTSSLSWTNRNLYLADRPDLGRAFSGRLDEIRLSNIARSEEYIKTSYNNQRDLDSFYTIDSEQVCGNGAVEGSEICDSSNLNEETCISQGFTSGVLSCLSDCSNYNTSECSLENPTEIIVNTDCDSCNVKSLDVSGNNIEFEVSSEGEYMGKSAFQLCNVAGKKVDFENVNVVDSNENEWDYNNFKPKASYDNETWFLITDTDYNDASDIFSFSHTFTEDCVMVSSNYYYPTYKMYDFVYSLSESDLWDVSNVGSTVLGKDILLIESANEPADKTHIWMIAGQHPEETSGIYQLEAFLNKFNETHGENLFIHAVLMMNIDGVYLGRTRTNSNGVDLNRAWDDSSSEVVNIVRALIDSTNNEYEVDMFVDWHGFGGTTHLEDNLYYTSLTDEFWNLVTSHTSYTDRTSYSTDPQTAFGYAYSILNVPISITLELSQINQNNDLAVFKSNGEGFLESVYEYFYG